MKNKKFLSVIVVLLAIVSMCSMLLIGCDGEGDDGDGLHVVDPVALGGENVLDDGGKINTSEPVYVKTGAKFTKERRIVLGVDDDKYELHNQKLEPWGGAPVQRCKITKADSGITFRLDFSKLEDRSKIGCRITLIRYRAQTSVSVSTDKENWTEIGYPDKDSVATVQIKSDYAEHVTDLRNAGYTISDEGLWQFYWNLGDYADETGILYLRCGYSDEHSGILRDKGVGTDIIDHISYFETLDYVYELF